MPGEAEELPAAVNSAGERRRAVRLDGILVLIVLLAALSRFWRLGSQSFWSDEWLTTNATSGSLSELLRHVERAEGIAPPYFYVAWVWVRLFGDSEVALRSLSALAGIATVPVMYAAVREFEQRRATARIAALLAAVSPMLVWYSQEARPYAIVALLSAVTMLAFARVRRRGEARDFWWWGASCAVALAFHYFVVFLVAAEAISLIAVRREWRRVALAGVPSVAVLVVLAPVALRQQSHTSNGAWISKTPLVDRLRDAQRAAVLGPSYPYPRLLWASLAVVAVAAVLVVTVADRRTRSVATVTAGIGLGAIALPLILAGLGFDFFLSRYLIGALIPLIIAVSVGFTAGRRALIAAICVTFLCASSLATDVAVARDAGLQRADWRSVAAAFRTGSHRRLLAINVGGNTAQPLHYYLPGARFVKADQSVTVDDIDVLVLDPDTKPCSFSAIGTACEYIFLGAPLPQSIAAKFKISQQIDLGQFRIDRYRSIQPVQVTDTELLPPISTPDGLIVVPAIVQPRPAQ